MSHSPFSLLCICCVLHYVCASFIDLHWSPTPPHRPLPLQILTTWLRKLSTMQAHCKITRTQSHPILKPHTVFSDFAFPSCCCLIMLLLPDAGRVLRWIETKRGKKPRTNTSPLRVALLSVVLVANDHRRWKNDAYSNLWTLMWNVSFIFLSVLSCIAVLCWSS